MAHAGKPLEPGVQLAHLPFAVGDRDGIQQRVRRFLEQPPFQADRVGVLGLQIQQIGIEAEPGHDPPVLELDDLQSDHQHDSSRRNAKRHQRKSAQQPPRQIPLERFGQAGRVGVLIGQRDQGGQHEKRRQGAQHDSRGGDDAQLGHADDDRSAACTGRPVAAVTAAVMVPVPIFPVVSINAGRSCHPSRRSCKYREA